MKTMSAMEVRKHFGAVLDEVRIKAETIVLERAGHPIAMIKPLTGKDEGRNRSMRLGALRQLDGLGRARPRSDDIDQWVAMERAGWGR